MKYLQEEKKVNPNNHEQKFDKEDEDWLDISLRDKTQEKGTAMAQRDQRPQQEAEEGISIS